MFVQHNKMANSPKILESTCWQAHKLSPHQRFLLYNTSKHLDSPKPADSLIRSIGGLKNSQNVLLMPKAMKGPTRLQTPLQFPYCTARYLQCTATNDGSSLQNPARPTWVSMVEKGDNNMHLFCISFYSITTRLHRMGRGGVVFLKNTTPLVHSPKQLVKQLIW